MLCLGRKVGDIIEIGDEITIKVLRINGQQIRIGIDAPAHIPIKRGEIDGVVICDDLEKPSEST